MSAIAIRNMPKIDMRKLPALSKMELNHVNLPANYLAARKSLRECWRIDEVKDIKDKHSAIAHYAKQVKDKTLEHYAERIKLRAMERLGELLAEIPDRKERNRIVKSEGISYGIANQAINIQDIPQRVRDTMIEASPPEKLARMSDASHGYSGYRTGGLWRHAAIEAERVKHTPKVQIYKLLDYLKSVKADTCEFMGDGVGGSIGLYALVRAIDSRDIRYARKTIEPLIEMLDSFDRWLSERERA